MDLKRKRPLIIRFEKVVNGWKPKRCCTQIFSTSLPTKDKDVCATQVLSKTTSAPVLDSLPDDLMSRIVSMLPTKDAAAMQVLSKTVRTRVFGWITSVDFDDSPISFCIFRNHQLGLNFCFQQFVDNVLHKLSRPLTRYRLRVGGDRINHIQTSFRGHTCFGNCFPYMNPSRLYTWISYPLAHPGLRELDLSFHVRKPSDYQLPVGLFSCKSLEMLKLDSNFELRGADITLICLPNLKLLHLHSFLIIEDDFISRLVSCCPSLEDLAIAYCSWPQSNRIVICSHSLKRLMLIFRTGMQEMRISDLMVIDTPNLWYFHYAGTLPHRCSIANMNGLVQAFVADYCWKISPETQLKFFAMMANVQHLSLLDNFILHMCSRGECGDFKDHLPVFRNLKTLKLGGNSMAKRWDQVMSEFLTCSPSIETLAFPQGLFLWSLEDPIYRKMADMEELTWNTTEALQCCQSNLKRIVIDDYLGSSRELNIVKFLLRKAPVLQEFVIRLSSSMESKLKNFHMLLKRTLEELPRASIKCQFRCDNIK